MNECYPKSEARTTESENFHSRSSRRPSNNPHDPARSYMDLHHCLPAIEDPPIVTAIDQPSQITNPARLVRLTLPCCISTVIASLDRLYYVTSSRGWKKDMPHISISRNTPEKEGCTPRTRPKEEGSLLPSPQHHVSLSQQTQPQPQSSNFLRINSLACSRKASRVKSITKIRIRIAVSFHREDILPEELFSA